MKVIYWLVTRLVMQDERQEEEEREVAEVEMLLGAYYMILDSTWDKLIDISEFVEDAEVSNTQADSQFTAASMQSRTTCILCPLPAVKYWMKHWTAERVRFLRSAGAHGPRNGHLSQQHD